APETAMTALPIGKAETKRQGKRIALLAFGSMVNTATAVGEVLDATVVNMRFIKPLDDALIVELAASHDLLVTIEENAVIGGAGSEVARVVETLAERPRILRLGLPDNFIDHGEQGQLLASIGLDKDGILASIAKAYPGNS
ncbi:MAG: 1-deoxy-D-xylulose-5-phosphate synthase, partial [Azoarcus sp.]